MPAQPQTTEQDAEQSDGPKHTNRLINETSPYLLQHAHNPVNWYPWGPEAFEAARRANKPIFLSIGYSTCYWCHVMERESFEIEEVAALLNEHFIAIKLDREERPDVDDVYMAAVQAMRGRGGWPMSVFLEPTNLQPFFGGTYFPKTQFMDLLTRVNQAWSTNQQGILGDAGRLAAAVVQQLEATGAPRPIGEDQVQLAQDRLARGYDPQHAGFGGGSGTKFPMPVYLEFLIGAAWDDQAIRDMIIHTLDRMAMGGMYDQIGGGFHRYSTVPNWLIPHFEKMVYDNGQLASVYVDAYERTGDPYYAEVVRETLDYILREMVGPHGAFYSAQDAEVNHREGQNYIWVADQIRAALTEAGLSDDIDFTLDVYGFNAGTNFQDPHHRAEAPKNVVFLGEKPARKAESLGISLDEFNQRIERINAALLAVRDQRDQPGTDDKTLTGWNGLMIAGMADGGRILGDDKYIDAARTAAEFILYTMRTDDGGLLRTYRNEQAKISAFLVDYAFLARGLIALYDATEDSQYLEKAITLMDDAKSRFWDDNYGAYYDTLPDQADLFVRTKSTYDGAVPCGNSIMANNLLDLAERTNEQTYRDQAQTVLAGISADIERSPIGAILSTLALHRMLVSEPGIEIVAAPPAVEPAIADPATVDPPAVDPATADPTPEVVAISTDVAQLELADGGAAELELTLEIAQGYHINAHDPGMTDLIGVEVTAVGAPGLALTIDYPQGEAFMTEMFPEAIFVHEGAVTIRVRLEQTGPVTGRPRLIVTYQACTDKVCLAPESKILDVKLSAATPDD